jgi:hypothetical protein
LYAERTDELVFAQPGEPGFGKLVIEIPWSGAREEIHGQFDGGMWRARYALHDLPVQTLLRYQWVIAPEQGGDIVIGPWEEIARPDPASTAREWLHTPGKHVDVFTGPGIHAAAAQMVTDAADAGYVRALERLGDVARIHGARPRVVLVQTKTEYAMLSSRGGAGYAESAYGVTVQWMGGYGIEDLCAITIPHEIFHLLDPTALREDVPAWFTEGLAVQNEVGFAWADDVLREARRSGALIEGGRMAEYPRDEMDEVLWYAQAWSMMQSLDDDQVQGLLTALVDGQQFYPAWITVVGDEPEAWMGAYLGMRTRSVVIQGILWLVIVLSSGGLLWLGWDAWRNRRTRG